MYGSHHKWLGGLPSFDGSSARPHQPQALLACGHVTIRHGGCGTTSGGGSSRTVCPEVLHYWQDSTGLDCVCVCILACIRVHVCVCLCVCVRVFLIPQRSSSSKNLIKKSSFFFFQEQTPYQVDKTITCRWVCQRLECQKMEFAVTSSYYILPGKCACQSERSPRYFHLDRISDFAIRRSSSHTLLAAEKIFRIA